MQGRQWRQRVSSAPRHGALWGFLARAELRAGGPARRPAHIPTCSAPILRGPGSAAPAYQARLLGRHFATRGARYVGRSDAATSRFLAAPAPPVDPVSTQEVRGAVSRLRKSSAPGRDAIPVLAWGHLPRTHVLIAALFTHVLRTGFVPQALLRADVAPIPKPGRTGVAPYRPISLLPSVAKILERVVLDRVLATAGARLPSEQYAFCPGLSCEVLLADLGRAIGSAQDAGLHALLISLDIGGAYDSVRPRLLLRKAVDFGLPAWAVRWLRTWTSNRFLRVRLRTRNGACYPPDCRATCGLPQGGVLSPFFMGHLPLRHPRPPGGPGGGFQRGSPGYLRRRYHFFDLGALGGCCCTASGARLGGYALPLF